MLLGNDLVDLQAAGARGKARDTRFVRRVCSEREVAAIERARDPDRTLWSLWAAKEAAFKLLQKIAPDVRFRPRCLEIEAEASTKGSAAFDAPDGSLVAGQVRLRGADRSMPASVTVVWRRTPHFVHCLALADECPRAAMDPGTFVEQLLAARRLHLAVERGADLESPLELTPRELPSARRLESQQVRSLAKRLARSAGLGSVELVREVRGVHFGPPRLYWPGASLPLDDWDVSLSHDGALVAAALGRGELPAAQATLTSTRQSGVAPTTT